MLSFFKKKKPATLKERVAEFWSWYEKVADRFYQTIEDRHCPDLQTEVSQKIDELFKGFPWEFGPGEQKGGHSFTLSGGGILHRQMVTRYWLSQAPKLKGWSFYSALQPVANIDNHSLVIDDHKFEPIEFWLSPTIDTEEEKIDLSFWHPMFPTLSKGRQWNLCFLFLDQVLGEYGTCMWIGDIDLGEKQLADSIPIRELPGFVEKTQMETGWKKYPPGECYVGYSFKEPHNEFLRGDIIAGTTSNFKLVNEYSSAKGAMDDPLKGTGADFVFIALDTAVLPKGNESHARGEIEDELEQALSQSKSGYLLGGACGTDQSYIDLMIFDGDASLKIVQNVLKRRKLPSGTSINFFAKDRKLDHVVLR